jgi:hypothetical protein
MRATEVALQFHHPARRTYEQDFKASYLIVSNERSSYI